MGGSTAKALFFPGFVVAEAPEVVDFQGLPAIFKNFENSGFSGW